MVTNNFWKKLKKPFFCLAPLEGVTDIVYRNLIRTCGAPDVFFTEFVNTDGLCSRGKDGVIHRLRYDKKEKPIVAQVWGNKPENYLKVAKEILDLGFDGIDINCGCSVPKVVKNDACGALIRNPELVKEIFLATKEGVGGNIPVSIKTRIGFRKVETESWASFLLSLNPAAITFHARCVKEVYSTPARWEEIKKIVDIKNEMKSDTIIIGNGDVVSFQDGIEKYKHTGVDGIMIGRAAMTNPFIFNDVPKDYFLDMDLKEKIEILEKHAKMFCDFWGEEKDFRVMKLFYKTYFSGFKGASALRVKSMQINTYKDFLEFIKEIKEKIY